MRHTHLSFWKEAPFTRLVFPFIVGIIIQTFYPIEKDTLMVCCFSCASSFLLLNYLPLKFTSQFFHIQSFVLQTVLISAGMLITANNNQMTHSSWYGHHYQNKDHLIVALQEPPIQKPNSIKAEAAVFAVLHRGKSVPVTGRIIIYFSKDVNVATLKYGDQLILQKPLQLIGNSGNPGAFDYKKYAARQQLFHTVYLRESDYVSTGEKNRDKLQQFLIETRTYILSAIKKNIKNDPNVLGIAEALLIGYKEDLDKDLVQAYSNTGVVHIIAISGLHLGLIYVMLTWFFDQLPYVKKSKIIKLIFIIGFLWIFALLTGASASVLRSAVMFTTIVLGKFYFQNSSIYNSLASSAFLLLCYDPNFLWDVGFQLSYLAVYGIVWLQKPIAGLFYFPQRLIHKTWEMASVTLAAQIITTPICLFYFHQFPNTFLIANLITVPLSSVILFAEIILVICSPISFLATIIGELNYWLIYLMNTIILFFDRLPFSITDQITATIPSTISLYIFVLGICSFWVYRKKYFFHFGISGLLLFTLYHSFIKINIAQQQKIIIYNVPKRQAIDFIHQDKFLFVGDSSLLPATKWSNFYLKPSRVSLGAKQNVRSFPHLIQIHNLFIFDQKTLMVVDSSWNLVPLTQKIKLDILVISGNPNVDLKNIFDVISPSIVVFDGTNSLWKIAQWKTACEDLLLPCFSVAEEGAFIYDAL